MIDASRVITDKPKRYRIAGEELVVYRASGSVHVAPNTCPHMGAALHLGCVRDEQIVCAWHGLALGPERHGAWRPFRAHDDGVLVWVQILRSETPTKGPVICARPRPATFIDAVMRKEATCEPRDVLQNRLDPWHGVHYHPHSFGSLSVIDQRDDEITVRVNYRIARAFSMEVDARFHCPDRRTIVMTIVDGDGKGSVVETHATPIAAGQTAIIEATLATSDRPGFQRVLPLSRWLRPVIERRARRLWIEDAAYAERLYELRQIRSAESARDQPDDDLRVNVNA